MPPEQDPTQLSFQHVIQQRKAPSQSLYKYNSRRGASSSLAAELSSFSEVFWLPQQKYRSCGKECPSRLKNTAETQKGHYMKVIKVKLGLCWRPQDVGDARAMRYLLLRRAAQRTLNQPKRQTFVAVNKAEKSGRSQEPCDIKHFRIWSLPC